MSDQSAAVQRTSTDLEKAKATEITAQAVVNRAQAVEQKVSAQIDDASNAIASIEAQERIADPSNDAAFRRLSVERNFLESKRRALEGALTRAQAEHVKARADLDVARDALANAEQAAKSAQEKFQRAEEAHREAQLVATGDPSALSRKAERDRAQAVLDEHTRIVRSHGVFSPGGAPCEASIEAEKIHTRLSTRQPLDANEIGWGTHAEGAGRNVSPVGFRGPQEQAQVEGSKPYDLANPLNND